MLSVNLSLKKHWEKLNDVSSKNLKNGWYVDFVTCIPANLPSILRIEEKDLPLSLDKSQATGYTIRIARDKYVFIRFRVLDIRIAPDFSLVKRAPPPSSLIVPAAEVAGTRRRSRGASPITRLKSGAILIPKKFWSATYKRGL